MCTATHVTNFIMIGIQLEPHALLKRALSKKTLSHLLKIIKQDSKTKVFSLLVCSNDDRANCETESMLHRVCTYLTICLKLLLYIIIKKKHPESLCDGSGFVSWLSNTTEYEPVIITGRINFKINIAIQQEFFSSPISVFSKSLHIAENIFPKNTDNWQNLTLLSKIKSWTFLHFKKYWRRWNLLNNRFKFIV